MLTTSVFLVATPLRLTKAVCGLLSSFGGGACQCMRRNKHNSRVNLLDCFSTVKKVMFQSNHHASSSLELASRICWASNFVLVGFFNWCWATALGLWWPEGKACPYFIIVTVSVTSFKTPLLVCGPVSDKSSHGSPLFSLFSGARLTMVGVLM